MSQLLPSGSQSIGVSVSASVLPVNIQCWFPLGIFTQVPAEYIIRNTGLEEAQAAIKIAGRNINDLRYADDTTFMAESEEELKSLLMKVRGEWNNWLKAQHSEN